MGSIPIRVTVTQGAKMSKTNKTSKDVLSHVFVKVKEIPGGFEVMDDNGAVYTIKSETDIQVEQTCSPDPE